MCGELRQNESEEMNGHIKGADKGVGGERLTVCFWIRRGNDEEMKENIRGDGGQGDVTPGEGRENAEAVSG